MKEDYGDQSNAFKLRAADGTFTGTIFASTSLSYNATLTFVVMRKMLRPA